MAAKPRRDGGITVLRDSHTGTVGQLQHLVASGDAHNILL
jgi:hypothetical protein